MALIARAETTPPSSRRIAVTAGVSVLLHGALLLLLWYRAPAPEPDPAVVPPAAVSMVFNSGRPEQPATPDPVPDAIPSPPRAEAGAPPPPPPPTPSAAAETPPVPSSSDPEPPIQEAMREEPTALNPPPDPSPAEPAPPSTQPDPAPLEMHIARPIAPPKPPAPSPRKPPQPDFPAPMDYSLTPTPPTTVPGRPGKPLMSLGLSKRGPEDSSPFSLDTDAEVGPDWRSALIGWVQEHAYYPEQAARLHQDGDVRVQVTAAPNGKVLAVELERRSGSPWLDLALQALFRGAQLPPMPQKAGPDPVTFHFTMRYILVH